MQTTAMAKPQTAQPGVALPPGIWVDDGWCSSRREMAALRELCQVGLDQMWGENRSQQYHCAARASPGKRVSAAEGGDSGE